MAARQTKHLYIALLLLSLIAQSFAYAYAPCPEQMDMDAPAMTVNHSTMNMADPTIKKPAQGSGDNCCDTQQNDCPKSSCATAALLNNSTVTTLHSAPQTLAKLTASRPKPALLISLYRPPITR